MGMFERFFKEQELLEEAEKTSFVLSSEDGLEWYKRNADIQINDKKVSSELLKRLLLVDSYYEYIEKLFSDKIDKYTVTCITKDIELSKDPITLSKIDIIKGIETCISKEIFELDEMGQSRLTDIRSKVDFKLFEDEVSTLVFFADIDGENYEVDAKNIFEFLKCSDGEYNDFFNLNKENNIYGMSRDKFAFLVVKFVDDYDIFSNYLVPDEITARYEELKSNKKIDIEAMNEIRKTYYPFMDKVKVNWKFKQEILDGLPYDAGDLEKAIYIYIKLCKSLNYDDEFYAFNMKNKGRIDHGDINRLGEIHSGNNKVVCYEFNAIFAYFLNQLGIKFISDVNPYQFGGYSGSSHANLMFRDSKFLVNADAVSSVLRSDLTKAKLNQPLGGLTCINSNEQTQQEFKEKVTRMYELVAKQEKELNNDNSKVEVEKVETYDDIVSKYRKASVIKKVNLKEKFEIMADRVNETSMYNLDAFSYFLQLKKILFSELEQRKNIQMNIIKRDLGMDSARSNLVISLNESGFDEEPEETLYYLHDGFGLRPVSKDLINGYFDIDAFGYIVGNNSKIPGINDNDGRRRI